MTCNLHFHFHLHFHSNNLDSRLLSCGLHCASVSSSKISQFPPLLTNDILPLWSFGSVVESIPLLPVVCVATCLRSSSRKVQRYEYLFANSIPQKKGRVASSASR